MDLRKQTLELVKEERSFTAKILKNLIVIEKERLYSRYGYSSLYKYLIKELGYTDSESYIRVGAVRLALRDERSVKRIETGTLSLTNASMVNTTLERLEQKQSPETLRKKLDQKTIKKIADEACDKSTRQAKEDVRRKFTPQVERKEVLTLKGEILDKVDRAKKTYGEDLSTYELLEILLEEKLKTPKKPLRKGSTIAKVSRYIPKEVKYETWTSQCSNCGERRNLEYDHHHPFSKGGTNSKENIKILCRSCNKGKGASLQKGSHVSH